MGNSEATKTYKGIQRLPCGFARIETIIDFVCPWSHLDSTDEIGVDFHLRIEAWEQRWKVITNEMGLRSCCRVEGRQGKTANVLYDLVSGFRVVRAKGVPNPGHELSSKSP